MCKTCELKGIQMDLNPLEIEKVRKTITLPDPWPALMENGFHPDLIDRAYAYLGWIQRRSSEREMRNARAFLASLGKGFHAPFSKALFPIDAGDPLFTLKTSALTAIEELAWRFGNRVSTVQWNSFAHLAVRENPEEARSILKEQDLLPHHYGIVDTCLHAAGKVYTFLMETQSVFFRHTGRILVHNCDCSCSLINLEETQGSVDFQIQTEQGIFEATQSLFTHQLAESHLLINEKLPFEFSITKEAQELFGLSCTL